ALNGLYGDYLARTRNPLALDLSLRYEGEPLDIRDAERLCAALRDRGRAPRLLVLVHGLCLNERHWMRKGHDHGAALAREMDFVPLYVRYNTGLPVSANGRVLARTLERLLQCLPVPVPEISILAHSMGGLVTRGALDQARRLRHAWPDRVRTCVFLGTPHHGAPLERAGHGLECILASSPYVVPFVRLSSSRSAGIRDLRHGTVGNARRFVPLPSGLRGYAIAATLDARQSAFGDRLLGDGLVPLDSALGRHSDLSRNLAFPPERQWIAPGVGHLDLLSDPAVYDRLRGWLD
ncbi:MAG TPA: hypothetical protein VLT59_01715, partial [Steroidobacteraceae bacterium]|nr:hypothetical protein [Steroidobacteraceae bacterium]